MDERHVPAPGPRPTSELAEHDAPAEDDTMGDDAAADHAGRTPASNGRRTGISRRRPRIEGEVTGMPAIQIALGLLTILLFLLVLWAIWPLISGV